MVRIKPLLLAVILWLVPVVVLAQTSPNWPFGYVPTTAEWNTFLASKADYTGSAVITASGATFTGKVNFASSSAGTAGMNCGAGTAPSSPINGDLWCTTAGVFAQINGSTIALGTSGGTLAVTAGGTGVTSFTANLPILGNGTSALTQGTRSGNTTTFGTVTGTTTSGDCVSFDASGNLHSAGVGACGGTGGAGTVASASVGQLAIYTAATTVAGLAGCNNGYFGTNGAGTVSCITTVNTTLSGTITALGTIATGVWQGTLVGGTYGGTGVNNGASTITLGGNFVTSGAAVTLTAIGATNVTLPTSGTLLNQNGTSGGIPYYNSATTVQSSGALTANRPVIGGGAGASPTVGTVTSTNGATEFVTYAGSASTSTHCASWDANHNLTDSGATCAGASGGAVLLVTLNCAGINGCTDINSSCAPASATTGCFDSTYTRYEVDLENLVASTPGTAVGCQIHVYNAGGAFQTTGYLSNYFTGSGTTSNITSYIACWPSNSGLSNNLATPGASGSFIVYNPSASSKAQWNGRTAVTANASIITLISTGYWNTNSAIVGFRVCAGTTGSPGSCSMNWGSGTIKVYGLP